MMNKQQPLCLNVTMTDQQLDAIIKLLGPGANPDGSTAERSQDELLSSLQRAARVARHMAPSSDWQGPRPFYCSVYEHSRVYGGPEEGGWYTDRQELVDYIGVMHASDLPYALQKLIADHDLIACTDLQMFLAADDVHHTDLWKIICDCGTFETYDAATKQQRRGSVCIAVDNESHPATELHIEFTLGSQHTIDDPLHWDY